MLDAGHLERRGIVTKSRLEQLPALRLAKRPWLALVGRKGLERLGNLIAMELWRVAELSRPVREGPHGAEDAV